MKYHTSLAFTASASCESELICFAWSACSLDSNALFDFSMATATDLACLDCSLVALSHSSSEVWGLSSWSSLTECVQLILKICDAKSQFNELFVSALLDFAPACLLGRLGFHQHAELVELFLQSCLSSQGTIHIDPVSIQLSHLLFGQGMDFNDVFLKLGTLSLQWSDFGGDANDVVLFLLEHCGIVVGDLGQLCYLVPSSLQSLFELVNFSMEKFPEWLMSLTS